MPRHLRALTSTSQLLSPHVPSSTPPLNCSRFVVVSTIDWRHGAQHMWEHHGVTVAEANEATADIEAVWFDPDPHSKSGHGVRVIGYCHSRRTILTVMLVHREDTDGYWGANGWESNTSDRRRYERSESL